MSKYYLGVDLGSTTSKAVIINEKDEIIGKGITNTRANYKVAADIARQEAVYDTRFTLLNQNLRVESGLPENIEDLLVSLDDAFHFLEFDIRLQKLYNEFLKVGKSAFDNKLSKLILAELPGLIDQIRPQIKEAYLHGGLARKSQFFRDVVNEQYTQAVDSLETEYFEKFMLVFDKSITPVENEMIEFDFKQLATDALNMLLEAGDYPELTAGSKLYQKVAKQIQIIADEKIDITNMVGTGYGRALLPFPESCIKSEILCHAFGAHAVFPNTRTVLDIGGQDTKAIQVDGYGLVTSFHMNDRCAAGCGRYLGYIADELNISLNELGPLAMEAEKQVNICSTCTVFAGAELRELLNVGEKRSDILAGLHRSIVMRAMSLIARSGGVHNEFTFTGGVARNQAVLKYVSAMIHESYGEDITINVHTDSIFMGALGGAMFARRNIDVDLPEKQKRSRAKAV